MHYSNKTSQYIAAAENEKLLSSYPDALDFSSADPVFLHPSYYSDDFKNIHLAGYQKLNKISEEMLKKMRAFLAGKIQVDVPEENFVYSLSTFRIFRAVLNCLPRVYETADNTRDDTTVLLSPQGLYFLFNRITGDVLKHDDCIETIPTNTDKRYKLCAEDIQAWADDRGDKFRGRPLLLLLENPSTCGHLYTAEELKAIDTVCDKHNIYIFTDEVYRETYHEGEEFLPLAAHTKNLERTISVFALSKSYGNLQYSLSFARVPAKLKSLVCGYVGDDWRSTTLHHNYITHSILESEDTAYLAKARKAYTEKKKLVTQCIKDLNTRLKRPIEIVFEPQAGYATVMNFTKTIKADDEIAFDPEFKEHIKLFKKFADKGLIIQSLHASGIHNELCFRMVYGKHSEADIAKAFHIIEDVIKDHE